MKKTIAENEIESKPDMLTPVKDQLTPAEGLRTIPSPKAPAKPKPRMRHTTKVR